MILCRCFGIADKGVTRTRGPGLLIHLLRWIACCGAIFSSLSPQLAAQGYDFSAIDSVLDANAAALRNTVVVMIRHNGKLVYYRGIGIDSTEQAQIASMSKSLSAALILRLAQEGMLGLDDSLGRYKPVASSVGKGSCTVRQNFSHTGGWAGSTDFLSDRTLTLQQAVDSIIVHETFQYAPGTAFAYGGVSMHVAGAMAEIASGEGWSDMFQSRIAEPLGLTNTTFCLTTPDNPRIAGGICSTPADLLRFGEFIRQHGRNERGAQVVDSVWMEELWRDQTRGVVQLASPYPYHPTLNNPYDADTIRYGLGTWLDIMNPFTGLQEQISGAGAFGTHVWINRCHNLTGVFFTPPPVLNRVAEPVAFAIKDIARKQTPNSCGNTTAVEARQREAPFFVYPNPSSSAVVIVAEAAMDVRITNLLGREEWHGRIDGLAVVDVTGWARGMYFVSSAGRITPFIKK